MYQGFVLVLSSDSRAGGGCVKGGGTEDTLFVKNIPKFQLADRAMCPDVSST